MLDASPYAYAAEPRAVRSQAEPAEPGNETPAETPLIEMTSTTKKKFRPRFSLRTLAVMVTLVCAYFGAWEATKKWTNQAARSIPQQVLPTTRATYIDSPAPLIYAYHENGQKAGRWYQRTQYFLYLFGKVVRLPFESEVMPE